MNGLVRPWIAPACYVGVATLACILFTACTPPIVDPGLFASIPGLGALPGDLPAYWLRFAASFVLLGVGPLVVALLMGFRPADLGLTLPGKVLTRPSFWVLVLAAVGLGALGGAFPDIASYYPYRHDLVDQVRDRGATPFLVHAAAYVLLYYVPWETFFRGFFLLGLLAGVERGFPPSGPRRTLPDARPGASAPSPAVLLLVLFQTLPSSALHVGHPLSESIAAVPAGIALGILAWKTRSVVPGLVLHAAVGLGTDAFVVARGVGGF
ncbi:MAG: hypothetical protein JXB39_00855 [Deltaproteobacteria bacterium]|nr:hypothetical protein [Deltaproteobacteria bacterium]